MNNITKTILFISGIIFMLVSIGGFLSGDYIAASTIFLIGYFLAYKKGKELIKRFNERKKRQTQSDNCENCNKLIGFFDKINYAKIDSSKKIHYYCKRCGNEMKKIGEIIENLGFFEGNDLNYFEIGKNREIKTEITLKEIIKKLKGKEISEESIKEIIDLQREIYALKRRKSKSELREMAEKQYYGQLKTKRERLDEDLKETIFSKFNYKCAICDAIEGLHIHHKDKNPKNNRIDNLILLCGVCHKKVHMKVR